MNETQIFQSEEFGSVRVLDREDGQYLAVNDEGRLMCRTDYADIKTAFVEELSWEM